MSQAWQGSSRKQGWGQMGGGGTGHGSRHDLLGRMGCVFARALLTPLLKEQIQRYFILSTFV